MAVTEKSILKGENHNKSGLYTTAGVWKNSWSVLWAANIQEQLYEFWFMGFTYMTVGRVVFIIKNFQACTWLVWRQTATLSSWKKKKN